ncbi:response regulator [Fibrobacter sp. UWR3]|uniref:response regulator n=1 Tax=Fibrobacter sp. UWR3 TaxID=1896217 RepID=UPI0009353520|nr:response regulator [Fibrobacter sp. UWR3]
MFGRHLPLSEQALQVIEQIGEDMPGGFFIYKATGNEELLYANKATAAIRAMTTYARRIPIVAMTANAFADDIRKAKEVGMNDHISKPIDFKELAKIL